MIGTRARMRTLLLWAATASATVVLLGAGWGHRALNERISRALGEVFHPGQPLASLPAQLGDWKGETTPLDSRARQVWSVDDDYVNRAYISRRSRAVVGLYVGYVGRPRTSLAHRPDVCYAAHGWQKVSQREIPVTAPGGRVIPCVLYEFRQPDGFGSPVRVLATYLVGGRYSADPGAVRRYHSRSPNLFGERPTYLARVQVSLVSSGDEAADIASLSEFTSLVVRPIADLMPYWKG